MPPPRSTAGGCGPGAGGGSGPGTGAPGGTPSSGGGAGITVTVCGGTAQAGHHSHDRNAAAATDGDPFTGTAAIIDATRVPWASQSDRPSPPAIT